jgi:hypothetical protein
MAKLCTCNCAHEDTCAVYFRHCSMCSGKGGEGIKVLRDTGHVYEWKRCTNCGGEGRVLRSAKEMEPVSRGPLSVA